MRLGVTLLMLLVLVSQAQSKDDGAVKPPSAEQVADRVVAAVKGGDNKALADLASAPDPDPWLVCDLLEERGHALEALKFAQAATGPVFEPLARYLSLPHDIPGLAEHRATLRLAQQQRERAGPAAALKILGEPVPELAHIVGVHLAHLRGELSHQLARGKTTVAAFRLMAARAQRIGWRTQASEGLYRAGLALYNVSSYAEALKVFEKRLVIEKELASEVGIGRAHFALASVYDSLGEVEQEASHGAQARQLAERNGDWLYLAKAMANESLTHLRGEDLRTGLALLLRAIETMRKAEEARIPLRFKAARKRTASSLCGMLGNCASVSMMLGQSSEARGYARAAVQEARAAKDRTVLDTSRAFLASLEGADRHRAGRNMEALGQYEQARRLYARLGMRTEHADTLRRLAGVRLVLGDGPAALRAVQEAIHILTEVGARRELTLAQLEASDIGRQMGRLKASEAHAQEALRLARVLKHPQLQVRALVFLASVYKDRAELSRVLDALDKATKLLDANPGRTDPRGALNALSEFYGDLGDSQRAHEYLERSLKFKSQRTTPYDQISALTTKARFLYADGRYKEAVRTLRRVLATHETRGDRIRVAKTLTQIVEALLRRTNDEDWPEARALQGRVVGMAIAASDRGQEVIARIQLARTMVWTDQPELALEEATAALELAEDLDDVKLRGFALGGLAQVHYKRNEFVLAIQRAQQGAQLVGSYGLDLAEGEQALLRSRFSMLTQWGTAAAVMANDAAALYGFLERARATALVAALGGRTALRDARVPQDLRREEEEAKAAAAMAYHHYEAIRHGSDLKTARTRRAELDQARLRQQDAVSAIQRAVRSQAGLTYVQPEPLESVQGRLVPGDALLLYGSTGWQYVAQVITYNKVRTVILQHLGVVRKAVSALGEGGGTEEERTRIAELLLKPLGLGPGVRRLLICPIDRLAYVPFSALEPTRIVSLVPSATVYAMLGSMRVVPGQKVLALGDPAYGERPPLSSSQASVLRGNELVRLKATRAEVKAIGDTVLLGREASETRLRQEMKREKRWRAVHLACHGMVDDALPARSALILSHDASNDGFLYAGELFAQVPVSADLVVLSACETGRGRIYQGEGLVGLTRAFMLAGTPRILASLWKVDDASTSALMVKFYELWNPRPGPDGSPGKVKHALGAAAALKAAQQYVRTHPDHPEWKHPEYWAAWVLWGLPD